MEKLNNFILKLNRKNQDLDRFGSNNEQLQNKICFQEQQLQCIMYEKDTLTYGAIEA